MGLPARQQRREGGRLPPHRLDRAAGGNRRGDEPEEPRGLRIPPERRAAQDQGLGSRRLERVAEAARRESRAAAERHVVALGTAVVQDRRGARLGRLVEQPRGDDVGTAGCREDPRQQAGRVAEPHRRVTVLERRADPRGSETLRPERGTRIPSSCPRGDSGPARSFAAASDPSRACRRPNSRPAAVSHLVRLAACTIAACVRGSGIRPGASNATTTGHLQRLGSAGALRPARRAAHPEAGRAAAGPRSRRAVRPGSLDPPGPPGADRRAGRRAASTSARATRTRSAADCSCSPACRSAAGASSATASAATRSACSTGNSSAPRDSWWCASTAPTARSRW